MNRQRDSRGLTLLELIMALAVFMLLVNGAVKVYTGASRLSQVAEAALQCVADIDVARDELMKYCRSAQGFAASAGPYTASESLLLLQLDEARVAMLGQVEPDGPPVSMMVEVNGAAWEPIYVKALPDRVASLRFATEGRRVAMTILTDNLGMENTVPAESVVIAAFRGGNSAGEIASKEPAI